MQVSPGTYTVTISQGPLTAAVTQTVTVDTANVRLNFALPASAVQTDADAGDCLRDTRAPCERRDQLHGQS